MSGLDFLKPPWLYVEIGQSSLKVLNGEGGLDFPLDRQENGRLTRLCREQLTRSLHGFLKRKRWQPRMRALCAIGARGVSLRRLTLGRERLQLVRVEPDQLTRAAGVEGDRPLAVGGDDHQRPRAGRARSAPAAPPAPPAKTPPTDRRSFRARGG